MLIQGVESQHLDKIAENLKRDIAAQTVPPVGQVTASFGVTQFLLTDSMDSLIHRVDKAMYLAKQQGRNRVVLQ